MPKYMINIVEDTAEVEWNEAGLELSMAEHNDFAAAVAQAGGKILGGEALQPVSTATFLRGTRTPAVHAVDNPLPEVKEVVGGYYVIEAEDDAQALELAKLCPSPRGYIELRPVWEFGS